MAVHNKTTKNHGHPGPRGRGKGIATREFSQLMNCTARRGGGGKEKVNHEEEGDGEKEREVKERINNRIF